MKTISMLALALISTSVFAQGNSTTSKNIDVKSFSSIKANGVFTLKLSQGKESVRMEGDQELMSKIRVVNEGNTLVIKMEDKKGTTKSKKGVTVYVSFRDITSAEFNMVGDIESTGALKLSNVTFNNQSVGNISLNLDATSVTMKNKGVGEVDLKGRASRADLFNSGVGEVNAGSFKVQDMNVTSQGVGEVTVYAEKSIKVKSSGIGKVKNAGPAKIASNKAVEI